MSSHERAVCRPVPRWVLAAACLAAACEVPARSDSWQPAGDPEPAPRPRIGGDAGGVSAVIAAERARARHLEGRADTLTVHLDRQPKHLNPLVSPSIWTLRIADGPIFEPLLHHAPPDAAVGAARYVPALARSVSASADGLSLRVELRAGVEFHDGRPLTAADAVFSLETARLGRGGAGHLRRHLADVAAVEAKSERVVELELRRPSAIAHRALAQVPILPRHVYEGAMRAAPGEVVGTGPYRLDRWDDEGVLLSRFSGYWGEPAASERVSFLLVPDAAEALVLARRGAVDIMPELLPAHVDEQLEAAGLGADFEELSLRPPSLSLLALNAGRGPLQDRQVRRALSLAIDRRALVAEAHAGLARPAPGPVWPGGPVHGPPVPPFPHDKAAAARLLDDAGWEVGDRGIREKGGSRLRLSLLATEKDDPIRARIIDDLRAVGALVSTRVGPPAVLEHRIRQADFDLALVTWRGAVDRDPQALLGAAYAPDEPALAEALGELRDGPWDARRPAAAGALAAAFARSVPFVPLTAPEPRGLVSRRVKGVRIWNGWVDLARLELVE